ncbi:hypothetical protein [Marivirga harenae]|uniref:hypothetical protein n=1 Tax=Marivirga harenae TaxID=2010992 RepID=UPI0026DF5DBF|nr:hypothetical protein [Marivirga harenae]WKV10941.1 hypothetical protein Q3Y49_12030 [Marivirga harenae]
MSNRPHLRKASSSCPKYILQQFAFLVICLLLSLTSLAQNASNPVQVTSNLLPPYSLYLSDYSDASQNKWNIQLLLKDFTQTNYQAKLRITIEGAGVRLRTRRGFSPEPIRLDPGIPYQVDATDLTQYLNIQNMEVSGINRNQLASTQKLPEGFYQFQIEVLDYNRNNRVSNIGTSMAWLVLNDPPLLNLPFEEKIRLQDPQQVQFQWTPRHTSSPNSAFETEYVFRLWEIWPEGRNPNEVARTTQPLFETTIMTTSYFYGLNDAMLIPGRSYAWQVQAVNLSGRDLFKNQGNSEVRWFKYGDACQPITNLGAEANGTDRIRITWQGEWNHNRYVAQIREKGEEGWFNYGTNLETQVVYDLQADTEYEIRVIPSCGVIDGAAENVLTLKTLKQETQDFNCGAKPSRTEITNQEPIEQLQIGDRITAAGFTVILTQLNQMGDTYSGRGLIEVPLFNGARVEANLNNIMINTDKQLIKGNIESIYNPNGPFIIALDQKEPDLSEEGTGNQEEGEEDSFDELPEPDVNIEGEIADVEHDEEEGTITVTDTEGNTTEIDPETADDNEDGDIVIEDEEGNVYVVDEDGELSGPHNSGGEQENSGEVWFEYEELQYQSRTEINLSDNDSNHLITLIDYDGEEELKWSALNGDEDVTEEIFLDNPTDTDSANIVLPDDYDELELKIRIGEVDYSIQLINNNENTEEPIEGISRNPELLVINELTSSFTSSEERLELTYTYLDSLELNNSKIEIFKINEEDTTLVIFYYNLEKGENIEFVDKQDDIAGWSGKGTNNNFVEAGEYLLRITVSVDDSFNNGFEDYDMFEIVDKESVSEFISGKFIVFKDDANIREQTEPYNILNPDEYLEKGEFIEINNFLSEGDDARVMVSYINENIDYCTWIGNLKEVIEVSDNQLYKLKEDTKPVIRPYTEIYNLEVSKNQTLKVTHECGEFKLISKLENGEFEDLGWVKNSSLKFDLSNLSVEEFTQNYKGSTEKAATDIKSDWSEDEASCNLCIRAALYNLTGDDVLYPVSGSSLTIKDEGVQLYGKVSSMMGNAQGIINNLNDGTLDNYFEEIKKEESESYPEYWKRLQNLVTSQKEIIIGSYDPGHVFMIVPGSLYEVVDNTEREKSGLNYSNTTVSLGDRWGGSFARRDLSKVLRIMDCGKGVHFANGPLYGVMDARPLIGQREDRVVKFFKYIK